MAKEDLSAREKALLAEARREAATRQVPPPAAAPARAAGPAAPRAKPAPTPAERLAQLMADERAVSQEKSQPETGAACASATSCSNVATGQADPSAAGTYSAVTGRWSEASLVRSVSSTW
jgi:hypothetical protein